MLKTCIPVYLSHLDLIIGYFYRDQIVTIIVSFIADFGQGWIKDFGNRGNGGWPGNYNKPGADPRGGGGATFIKREKMLTNFNIIANPIVCSSNIQKYLFLVKMLRY